MLQGNRLTVTTHESELDNERRVWIGRSIDDVANRSHSNSQLFGQLADRGELNVLTCFQLATRKLPETTMSLMRRPLTNEVLVGSMYDSCEHTNRLRLQGVTLIMRRHEPRT